MTPFGMKKYTHDPFVVALLTIKSFSFRLEHLFPQFSQKIVKK
jgi:hypothetical protein